MAIQVNGTTVIDNSRNLSNVGGLKTVGGTAILGSGDIAVGESVPDFNPVATPNATFTSSGTWTKPSLSSGTWVVILMVGAGSGGNGGSWAAGGNGGSGVVIGYKASTLPSSIAFTVGAGSAGIAGDGVAPGGDTSATIDGRLYVSPGATPNGASSANYSNTLTDATNPGSYLMINGGTSPYAYDASGCSGGRCVRNGTDFSAQNSQFGGGAGAGFLFSSGTAGGGTAGTSAYAGNGGTNHNNGSAYGGGGGGNTNADPATGGNGGNGGVKIWYIS